jgi:hypothetical protein
MPKPPDPILPHGARTHPALRLVTWHPSGLLDAALANEILRFIELEEVDREPFNRFANLSGVDAVRLSFAVLAHD